jgi:hypothetical protein
MNPISQFQKGYQLRSRCQVLSGGLSVPAFDKNHEEAVRKAVKSGREVAELIDLFGIDRIRKSLALRHAPGVIRTHNPLIRSLIAAQTDPRLVY